MKTGLSGIYCITNLETGMKYIGKSVNIIRRLGQHLETTNKTDDLSLIHKAIIEYGKEAFDIKIICFCSIDDLDYWERYYIINERTLSWMGGYNIALPDTEEAIELPLMDEEVHNIIQYLVTTPLSIHKIASILDLETYEVEEINTGITNNISGYNYPLNSYASSFARQRAKWKGITTFFTINELTKMNFMASEYNKIMEKKKASRDDYLYWKTWYQM